ncbi:MAG: gluconeogenesis factor YvcK family protein [Ezakiella sp.]|uniref:gluconeogenesis factor YvcK family protein n=1 Tax=Ezakiella sp. TaxID=1935205 RepID=UPI002972B321|nr:gluconeogenesis factor YvcK family protein [Ezakiella sp.]MDD7731526.1 YvcK family protein [Eubacteriales bacterium]MDY6079653.1 gluconeogenesis factor YvcK family protein [Ezakiella sp.]
MIKLAAIGGGTGLSVLLNGLKKKFDVAAIVTVGDNGGGSGILREDLNMLPPGDIRNCLLALSEAPDDLRKLLSYRFEDGSLKGQSLGNLIIAGMVKSEGSFEDGIQVVSNVLNLKGKVYPVTIDNMDLCAVLSDGVKVRGESEIAIFALKRKAGIKELSLINHVNISEHAKEAILNADVVTLGPGSLYTSVICNLLVDGVREALKDKKVVYIANVMTQPEETMGYSLYNHVEEVERYLGREIDYVLANDVLPKRELIEKYSFEGSMPVEVTDEDREMLDSKLITGEFLEVKSGYVRSNATNITETLSELFYV